MFGINPKLIHSCLIISITFILSIEKFCCFCVHQILILKEYVTIKLQEKIFRNRPLKNRKTLKNHLESIFFRQNFES